MQQIILKDNTLEKHISEYSKDKYAYSGAVAECWGNTDLRKEISITNKSYTLATLINFLDKDVFKQLIPYIDSHELTKACEILDSKRAVKQLTTFIENNKDAKRGKTRKKLIKAKNKLIIYKSYNTDLSLTSSKIKLVKLWVRAQTEEQLINRALIIHKDSWKILADLCHLNPSEFSVKWFLPWCFGTPAPNDSIIYKLENAENDERWLALCEDYSLPYEYVRFQCKERKVAPKLLEKYNTRVAENEPLRTILTRWKEIQSNDANDIITKRLEKVEKVDLPYGALADLLMKVNHIPMRDQLIRIAQNKMDEYKMNLESPVVILCDASASMEVAIKTSAIISSLLCSLARAELRVFREKDYEITFPPHTAREAVKFAKEIRATNSTSPSSSLYYYETNKKIVKTFIVVTDEEENTSYTGFSVYGKGGMLTRDDMFAKTYLRYVKNVYPAKLIFISFTDSQKDGEMVCALKQVIGESMVNEFVDVHKFSVNNPDLRRLDYVLTKLSTESKIDPDDEAVLVEYNIL